MDSKQPNFIDDHDSNAGSKVIANQFGIAALFWITFIIGLGVAYLQRLNSPSILAGGVLSILIGLAVGALVGFLAGKIADALFWATLIAAFGYISVASDPAYRNLVHCLAWASVGACSGAIAATVFLDRFAINALACAIASGAVMATYYGFATQRSADLQFDLFCAPVIGLAIAVFVRMLMWTESQRRIPRYITATWLLVVIIIGNMIGR